MLTTSKVSLKDDPLGHVGSADSLSVEQGQDAGGDKDTNPSVPNVGLHLTMIVCW